MTSASRAHTAGILRRSQSGEELSEDDALMAQVLAEHPEYRSIFEQGADGPDEVDGINPWLHVTMHTVVERQKQLLPDVQAALVRLQERGLSEHEAQHRVAEIMVHQIWSIMKNKTSFNEADYLRQIRAL